jgi:hypothetical protein
MSRQPIDHDYNQEAEDRACLAVGRFFFHWAGLESQMNLVIGKLFNIDPAEQPIITANLKFIDKLYIIHTTLQWQGKVHNEAWRRRAQKLIRRIGRLNKSRNLMAHNLFVSLTNKTVRFYKVEAKGSYDLTSAHWSIQDFERTYCLIDAAYDELKELTAQLQNRRAIVRALAANPTPTPTTTFAGQGALARLLSLPPTPRESQADPASPETSPQTPASPQEKSEGD